MRSNSVYINCLRDFFCWVHLEMNGMAGMAPYYLRGCKMQVNFAFIF